MLYGVARGAQKDRRSQSCQQSYLYRRETLAKGEENSS
jgi:hypothetical protein